MTARIPIVAPLSLLLPSLYIVCDLHLTTQLITIPSIFSHFTDPLILTRNECVSSLRNKYLYRELTHNKDLRTTKSSRIHRHFN